MKRIALICFDNPFLRPMEGGKRGMLSRIEALAKVDDYQIEVFLLSKPTELNNKKNELLKAKNLTYTNFVIRSDKFKAMLSEFPISVETRFVPKLAKYLSTKKYDVAIYEGEHVSEYRLKNVVHAKRHILYMHDIESSYRADLAHSENNVIRKIAQQVESKKYYRLENRLSKMFDRYLFVSKDEKIEFEKRFPSVRGKAIYSPYATEQFADSIVINENHSQMLYIGNLMLDNNYQSIVWFSKNVLPLIVKQKPDAKLVIVGNISEEHLKELKSYSSAIDVRGYVPSLDDVIQESCLIISPVLYGAGVKVKLIDALASGQIVIANTKTAEGTELKNGRDLILEDVPSKFADSCVEILQNRNKYIEIARNGLNFVKREHSVEHHKDILIEAIEH